VLSYVEYIEKDILSRLRQHIERSLEEGRMTFEESAMLQDRYEAGLASYTYLAPANQAHSVLTPQAPTQSEAAQPESGLTPPGIDAGV
jgi:hypothetical protein